MANMVTEGDPMDIDNNSISVAAQFHHEISPRLPSNNHTRSAHCTVPTFNARFGAVYPPRPRISCMTSRTAQPRGRACQNGVESFGLVVDQASRLALARSAGPRPERSQYLIRSQRLGCGSLNTAMADETSKIPVDLIECGPTCATNFLSLPGELRNRIYNLVLMPTSSAATESKSSTAIDNHEDPNLNSSASPPSALEAPIKTLLFTNDNNPDPWCKVKHERHDGRQDRVSWELTAPAQDYQNVRAAHIPALLRSHPEIRAEASDLFYSFGAIVIKIDTTLLREFRHFTSRVISPLHAGMLFYNPNVVLNIVGHFGASDMECLLDWLVKCVPAAREWTYEIKCWRCRGCKLAELLKRNIKAAKQVVEQLRIAGVDVGDVVEEVGEAEAQGRMMEVRRGIRVAEVILKSLAKPA